MHFALLAGVAIEACLVTYTVLLYSRRKQALLDIPNARSSHTVPTPRGGGVGIVLAFVTAVSLLSIGGVLRRDLSLALAGGGLMVAGVGLIDDRRHVAPWARMTTHFVAAIWALYWLPGAPAIQIGARTWTSGPVTNVLCLIGIVWCINLTNFMDGIDGLAATESICVLAAGGGLAAIGGHLALAWLCWALAVACCGFLVFNWHPARIFMGDAGSGFLGFVLVVLLLAHTRTERTAFWPWLILFAMFWCDAGLTLFRRALRRERLYDAHRSHAYQHAARVWGHSKTTLAIAALNVCWLAPLAYCSYRWSVYALLFLMMATAPLVFLCLTLDAGMPDAPLVVEEPTHLSTSPIAFCN